MAKMTEQDKKFYVDQGIKVGLVLFAVYAVNEALTFGKPGKVDRVKFDLEATQNRYMPTGNPAPDDFIVVPDPWNPADLARRLFTALNGVDFSTGERVAMFEELNRLGLDRARWLHNYWLAQIDKTDTVYRWINEEWGVHGSKQEILANLRRWGVGF